MKAEYGSDVAVRYSDTTNVLSKTSESSSINATTSVVFLNYTTQLLNCISSNAGV